ncbi:MAG TPA: DUF1566 domain-containing protein [bacterium]|nr:DUF1566 domain-containing protein [bacterium]
MKTTFKVIIVSMAIASCATIDLRKNLRERTVNYDVKEDVVIDNDTKLVWQRGHGGQQKHASAVKYCQDLTLGGYDDWRLPSISELKTLIVGCQTNTDACRVSDSCLSYDDSCYYTLGARIPVDPDCVCPKGMGSGEDKFYWQKDVWKGRGIQFWSSSFISGVFWGENIWTVSFDSAGISFAHKDNANIVRCVRGPL